MKDTSSSIPDESAAVTRMEMYSAMQPPIPHTECVSTKMINYSELIHPPRASLAEFTEAPFFKITTIKITKGQRCAVAHANHLCN